MRRVLVGVLGFAVSCSLLPVSYSVAKETDDDVPLTGISTSMQPDLFTGTLTGNIPIEVPPGRNDMQPNLALTYASSGGNGWIGMGWKLEMGAIERQARWGVLYQPTTAEEQTGKVYTIRLNGVSTDLVQDTADPLLYHEKVKGSFLRIKKLSTDGTAGWEITDTKGTKYKFGTGATTRVQGTVGSLGTQIFKWCLERVEDRDGNYMTVTYTGDQGQGYLSQIDYAGNGATAPTNQVKFYLEDRSDGPDMYTSYFNIKTAKRLKTVVVNDQGILVRAYRANYTQSTSSGSSLLSSIQQFGKDAVIDGTGNITNEGAASRLPLIAMQYQMGPNGFQPPSMWGQSAQAELIVTGDFNANGRQDVIQFPSHSGLNTYLTVWTSTGTGLSLDNQNLATIDDPILGDFDGDGKVDIVSFRLPRAHDSRTYLKIV